MKELSIVEKAKAYDEAKLRMSRAFNSNRCSIDFMNEIFPELKESEDEKIVKELLTFFRECVHGGHILTNKEYDSWIAWLEKQGEHAKFRDSIQVGDKVTRNEDGVLVNLSQLKRVAKKDEKQGEQKPADKVEPKFKVGDIIQPKDRGHEPWQIMQVDILDKKYRFKDGYVIHFSHEDNYELVEQKTAAWSEEDDKILKSIIINIENLQFSEDMREKYHHIPNANKSYYQIKIDWLKSIKNRVQPQSKQEWNEEDKEVINLLLELIYEQDKMSPRIPSNEKRKMMLSWLTSLKPQNGWKPSDRKANE